MRRILRVALVVSPLVLLVRIAAAQQYPVMDMVAERVIQKYQQASCEQLWQRKSKPKTQTQREKDAIQLLRNDPQMRAAFINKVAGPIANKMFECGLIP
jgi:hypothetical protein